MNDLLEILRVQRHNFLNHLQVISGLLQLKKYDRVSEYIRQVGDNYNQDSLVGRMESPEIVGAILTAELAMGKHGIYIGKVITTNLEKRIADEPGTAEILKEIIELVGSMVQKTNYNNEQVIELRVVDAGDKYDFQVTVLCPGEESALTARVGTLSQKADQARCQISSCTNEGKCIITLRSAIRGN